MTLDEIRATRRAAILRIASSYGARNVRVFGSVARGEAKDGSDLDLLVELEPGRTLFDLGGLLYDVQNELGLRVDVATERTLRPELRARVLAEAVPL
jgi:uncharacterized protein